MDSLISGIGLCVLSLYLELIYEFLKPFSPKLISVIGLPLWNLINYVVLSCSMLPFSVFSYEPLRLLLGFMENSFYFSRLLAATFSLTGLFVDRLS